MTIRISNKYELNTGIPIQKSFAIDSENSTFSYKEAIEAVYDLVFLGKIATPSDLDNNTDFDSLVEVFRLNDNFALRPGNDTGFNVYSRLASNDRKDILDWYININNYLDDECHIFKDFGDTIYTSIEIKNGIIIRSTMTIVECKNRFDTINNFMMALSKDDREIYSALMNNSDYLRNVYNVIFTDLIANSKVLFTNYKLKEHHKYDDRSVFQLTWENSHVK